MLSALKHIKTSHPQTFNLSKRHHESDGTFTPKQNGQVSSPFNFNKISIQPKLKINTPGDRYEQEADRIADNVVNMNTVGSISKEGRSKIQKKPLIEEISSLKGSTAQRKCSKCEEEEKTLQRKSLNTESAVTNSAFNSQLQATKGGGSAMDSATNHYMSSRFGIDFSHVNIHANDKAAKMSQSINAKAFTLGNDIYFNKGAYNPESTEGKQLLAHELVHTVQQTSKNTIYRKLMVIDPKAKIKKTKKYKQNLSNEGVVRHYLSKLCPTSGLSVDASGDVKMPESFCKPPDSSNPSKAQASKTVIGCTCLCDIAASKNEWKIHVNDNEGPSTMPDLPEKINKPKSGGSGGIIEIPSPNNELAYGAVAQSGKFSVYETWLILGHELCGHAWLMNKGTHEFDPQKKRRGGGGHQDTVARENLIRDEHGIERRGTHRHPYCGESFSIKKESGKKPGLNTVKFNSEYLQNCINWRNRYNKLNKTRFELGQFVPIKKGEKLPK